MAETVQDATCEILKGIQASIAELRDSTETSIAALRRDVDARSDRLEEGMRRDWRNSAGMLVMMRATAGHFEERVTELEDRMSRVDGRKR